MGIIRQAVDFLLLPNRPVPSGRLFYCDDKFRKLINSPLLSPALPIVPLPIQLMEI
jgi:hypothetical protein